MKGSGKWSKVFCQTNKIKMSWGYVLLKTIPVTRYRIENGKVTNFSKPSYIYTREKIPICVQPIFQHMLAWESRWKTIPRQTKGSHNLSTLPLKKRLKVTGNGHLAAANILVVQWRLWMSDVIFRSDIARGDHNSILQRDWENSSWASKWFFMQSLGVVQRGNVYLQDERKVLFHVGVSICTNM